MSSETGFIRDNLEKVFRLCDILQWINSHPSTSGSLTLKGGTAINLLIFNLPRLSVDIDFDFCRMCSRDEMMNARTMINEYLLNYMFAQGYSLSPNTKNPHSLDSWVFYFQNTGGNKDNIKIEINYSMRHHILPIETKRMSVDFLQINDEWATLSALELFGGKIKAYIERNAPRDLYDIYNMLTNNIIHPDKQNILRKIVVFYLVLGDNKKIELPYNFAHFETMKYAQIRAKLIPLLKKQEKFDFETANSVVNHYLSRVMQLTDDEALFVEKFNRGIYQPDLLFDDNEIIERIKDHPMALWKMRKIICS